MTLLKEQLKQALANVEERERVQQGGQPPSTMAEVEELEQKLTDALEELRAQKAQMQKDNES